jgi:hypothetical protein
MHPRFKTPWVALMTTGVIAATWFVIVNLLSETAMLDTLSALGTLVAFYYSITGIACIVYYRRHVVGSLKGFVLVGLGPLLGSFGLIVILIVGIQTLTSAANDGSGSRILGLAAPVAFALFILVLGLVAMGWRMVRAREYFQSRPQVANAIQSPFILPSERPIPAGGVLIDCNHSLDFVIASIDAAGLATLPADTPVYLVAGVSSPELMGEEDRAVHDALVDDASQLFLHVQRYLKGIGISRTIPLYEEADADTSLALAAAQAQPARIVSGHRT